jgi:hypothetical protein
MSSEKPQAQDTTDRYHAPSLKDYGNARDLTRSNPGVGPDGAFFDGADSGTDGAGTAS